jgi:hypothetical protein
MRGEAGPCTKFHSGDGELDAGKQAWRLAPAQGGGLVGQGGRFLSSTARQGRLPAPRPTTAVRQGPAV